MTDLIAPNPFPIVPVLAADREALYGGLISAAHPIAYARRMADTLPDSDGSLQMLARYRLATASPEAERVSARIAEVIEDDGGCWHACSGCQESSEGYVSEMDYPYSSLFKCQPGGGCHECGGIGVLWSDGAFLASYGDALELGTPDPSCGPGEVERDDDEPAAWAVAAERAAQDAYAQHMGDPDGEHYAAASAAAALAIEQHALAALSPHGLDAKGLRALLQSFADAPHASYPGQLVKHVYASDCPTCIASHLLRNWPHATPSQRLDAATVERCAYVAETCSLLPAHSWQARERAREDIAAAIRRLATEPHQHGGKGA